MTDRTTIAIKNPVAEPDDVLELTKGRVHLVTLGDLTFDRTVFEPGWKWSEHVKPTAKTEATSPAPLLRHGGLDPRAGGRRHQARSASGRRGRDRTRHDAWVSSDVPCVMWGIDGDDQDFGKPKD